MNQGIKRGDVYSARLDSPSGVPPQLSTRPVVIVSRDIMNQSNPVVLGVPCVAYEGQYLYFSHVLIEGQESGLEQEYVAMAELVRPIAKDRLHERLGTLSDSSLRQLDLALLIALDLPGQM